MANYINYAETIIMASLSTLPSNRLPPLADAISALFRRDLSRLSSVLSSPILFSLTLRHLQFLTLHHKSLLIARHMLSSLAILHRFVRKDAVDPPYSVAHIKLRDLDAVLLLLVLCELHQHDRRLLDPPPSQWRDILSNYVSNSVLRLSRFGGCSISDIFVQYVESVGRCWNLVNVMDPGCHGKDTAASMAAVVALPSVEVSDGGGGGECAICKQEMWKGREVCELPCRHLFHWMCILKWLEKRSTCPCCRRCLPTDDVRREIKRLLEELACISGHCS